MKERTPASETASLLQRLDAQDAEIQRLRALVESGEEGHDSHGRSRRDMLRLAGAAVIGAAGATALRVVPAAAANGDPVTVGGSFTGTAETTITNASGSGFKGVASSNARGLEGVSSGLSGMGVMGTSDIGYGVYGFISTAGAGQGTGVFGVSDNTSGVGVDGFGNSAGALGGLFRGGRAPVNLFPAAAAGPPATGAHAVGDIWLDAAGILWTCITAGTPGACAPLQTGGANVSHFVKVSNQQYSLAGSDGKTWMDMDATNLIQTITPAFNAQAVISVSVDLWTANGGFNQDIGVFISGGAYGSGTIVAWKESGGSAGTFSPNAAFVETTQPLVAGTAYTIKVRWKTNKAGASTIFAGAGPLPVGSAGGGVAGQVSPTRLATHLVVDVPSPSVLHIPANDPSSTPPAPRQLRPKT